ncbi:MAG: hypothetical protein EXR68_01395 [Dehalococcoidia bacterium]|nr:hypothetical protein [Dehalococcoidia bacterium]
MTTLGQGAFQYELVEGWEQLPAGWMHGDVVGVAIDAEDRVFVFNRSEHPMLIYDRNGRFLTSWGEGIFDHPHGITIAGPHVYTTDDGDHTVRKFTLDGELMMTIGTRHQPSDTGYDRSRPDSLRTITRPAGPFNRPTRVAVAPNGELLVADGYGNARVHRFSPDGALLASWGEQGEGPGQFNLPHAIWLHTGGRLFICDRENDRIQIFTSDGVFLDQWTNVTRPGDLYIDAEQNVYIGELYWMGGKTSLSGRVWPEERPATMTVRSIDGAVRSRFGGQAGPDPCTAGNLTSPHGIAVDSLGDIYLAEVSQTSYQGTIYRPSCHSLQKFRRVR